MPGRLWVGFGQTFSTEKVQAPAPWLWGCLHPHPHPRRDFNPCPCDTWGQGGRAALRTGSMTSGGGFSNVNNSLIPRSGTAPGPPSGSCCPQSSAHLLQVAPAGRVPLPGKSARCSPAGVGAAFPGLSGMERTVPSSCQAGPGLEQQQGRGRLPEKPELGAAAPRLPRSLTR